LNNSGVLPQLNVFNFNATGLVFTPGIQRPADGSFPNGPNLDGSVNGLVDNSVATLGTFDGVLDVSSGSLSLGDGGKLQLNLNQAVSSNGPLYLYLAEAGGSGEAVNGQISVSTNGREVPTVMSTDFGASGPSGDDISFTYHFTTAAGANVNEIAFQFALFSEELPEFAGSDFNDTFKILLNGVNLAHLSNGAAASVNNLLASPHVPLSSDLILNPVGTGPVAGQTAADGYTKLLTYVGAINPGQDNTLTIEVTDVRDGFLDSGILVKAATFVAGTAPGAISVNSGAVSTGAPPDVFEGSPPISIPITIDPGLLGHLTAPVTIDFTADSHLNLGNGVGVPFEKTFNPGDPLTFNLQVSSPDDHIIDGPRFDAIDLAVHSTDPTFNGLAVAPIVVQIDDPQSMLSISDVTKAEGDVGFTAFDFTVTRTGGTAPLTVDFSTGDGSATAASGDYNFLSGTLSFAAGETAKTIEVLVNGDIYKEGDETFSVNLKNPNGAIIADGQGIGTIVNDDGASTGDTSNTPANTTVVLGTTGGTVVNTTNGRVTLTGVVNNFATGAGNDSIAGNNNNDILNGGPGNDTIRGGNGADFLIGGPGNDRMTGGLGDDTFIFRPGFGLDTITDFSVGTSSSHHDTLDLRGLGFLSAADVVNNHTADLAGTAVIHSGADTITLTNVNTALLQSHQFDILT
jgi:Ca2+-binding RTX toxin-like protein